MGDLNLRINGDASSGQQAFEQLAQASANLNDAAKALTESTKKGAEETAKATVKWQELVNFAKKATELVVRYGVDAVKAYAEAERVQRQLQRAAGDYADVLGEQAEALSRLNRVDDDVIKQSAILLTQWGGAGAAARDVQQAVLDYAAAMGGDAVSATQELIRNVESGGIGFAKLGVHFTATGDKGKDLAAAVEALSKKFGGAAAADAQSLHGSMQGVSLAMEDLQKSIGGQISRFLEWSGAVGATEKALRGLQATVEGKGFEEERVQQQIQKEKALAVMRQQLQEQTERLAESEKVLPTLAGPAAEAWSNALQMLREDIARTQAQIDGFLTGTVTSKGPAAPALPAVTGTTNKGMKDAAGGPKRTDDERLADAKKFYAGLEELEAHAAEQEAKLLADREKQRSAFVAGIEKQSEDAWAAIEKQDMARAAEEAKREEEFAKALERSVKDALDRSARAAQQAKSVADQIGAAFVTGLTEQLSKLASGGEFDVALFVGDLLAAGAGIAGTVIGTYFGAPQVGAAIGNLAALGIRTGASAISNANKPRKYHEGGWVGDEISHLPRYHSGGWINPNEQVALLRRGERVATPEEVQNAGGPAALDAALSGRTTRPSVVVHVQAIDSKSAAESFVTDLGDGLRRALRSGQGAAPALLGANPR